MHFMGTVVHGEKVGGPFGIATANVSVDVFPNIQEGVHIVEAQIENVRYEAVMHFGERKTFGASRTIEVHILHFSQDIYGKSITIFPQKYLRETKKFQNSDLLFTQIEKDILMTQKYFLRKKIKASWKEYPAPELRHGVSGLIKKIAQKKEFLSAKNVLVYAPSATEVPFVEPLMNLAPEKLYFFPKIKGQEMEFYQSRYQDLVPGKFNLLEPSEKFLRFRFDEPCLVFVPAQAVDEHGHRLGRGGGFYDRFLAKYGEKMHTICVVPGFAKIPEIPKESHDQAVDEILVI